MEIAFLLFDGVTHLDAVGPYAVLQNLPDADVKFVARDTGTYRDKSRMLGLEADFTLDQVPNPDILVVPGGGGADAASEDTAVTDWVAHCHTSSRWTTSVCTGALILGGAGVLKGRPATTHWRAMETLAEKHGARPTAERVVRDGKVITAAGVSSGIDMALTLAALEAGEEVAKTIQLGIEYAPEPPFDAGHFATAPAERVRRWRAGLNKARR
ncbi:MAG: DJ-1/PfpI family protein [Proteobacteria bacterium]|nr:DJ-1/PfpI family protein [Pseudomonadota bacterium]